MSFSKVIKVGKFILASRLVFVFIACLCFDARAFNENTVVIEKADIDDRVYRYYVLDNKLRVLLISDPKADKAAAALNVRVGSYHDPVDREGLAHFLEHMLFLGTKKYPEADDYQAFISDNGGSHNAYTSSHNTNYFFDINNNQLEAALDRFSQFFTAPLFDEFYVDRERNAVHSEYQARIQDDFRRGYDVYRSVINQSHPEAKFNVGNLTTLADRPNDNVRDDLLTFYDQYYSSDQMSLVVLGNYPIDRMLKMVSDRFKQVPLKKVNVLFDTKNEPLFTEGQLPLEVIVQPVKELRQMSINFAVPSITNFYKEKPLDYIGHILGHEGKGSLLSLLKKRGLAESLSAGGRDKNDGTAAFYITVQLTKKGLEERALIRSLVFYVIEQIKQKGVERWRYEEKQLLSQIAFRFREKSTSINTVKGLAENIFHYSAADIISGDYLLERYDAELIQHFLGFLSPDNAYITTVFPEAETNKVSEYYQTPYQVFELSADDLEKKRDALSTEITKVFSLPDANPFIPEDLTLFAIDQSLVEPRLYSRVIKTSVFNDPPNTTKVATTVKGKKTQANKDIWVKQDTSFGTPTVKVQFRLLSPLVAGSLKGAAKASLYADLLQDRLNEYSYPALLAGAAVSVSANNRGIDITVQGFHDRLYKLMAVLLDEIELAYFESERFEQLKSDTLRRWRNNAKKTPYHQLYNQLAVDLYTPFWSDKAKINALEIVTLEELTEFAKRWRVGAQVKGLFYGNVNKDWLKAWESPLSRLQLEGEESIAPIKVMSLQPGGAKPQEAKSGNVQNVAQYDIRTVDHSDQAVVLYVQGSDDSLESQASMMVLRQLLQSSFYSSLRTEQQLGYIVFLGSLQLKEVPGSVFVVQSPSASIDKMRSAIENFIADYSNQLPDNIDVYKQAVITQLLELPTSLSANANDYWGNLLRGDILFSRRQALASAVEGLSAEQLKATYTNVVQDASKAIWIYSKTPENIGSQVPYRASNNFYSYP